MSETRLTCLYTVAVLGVALAAIGSANCPEGGAHYAPLAIHIAALVHEIDPALGEGIIAALIFSAIARPALHRMRSVLDVDTAALQASARALLQGLTRIQAPPYSGRGVS